MGINQSQGEPFRGQRFEQRPQFVREKSTGKGNCTVKGPEAGTEGNTVGQTAKGSGEKYPRKHLMEPCTWLLILLKMGKKLQS